MKNLSRVLRIKSGFDWNVGECEKVSFLNFSSITSYFNNDALDKVEYYCDGSISAIVIGMIVGKNVKRLSFDFTSLADPVFKNAEEKGIRLNVVGATEKEVTGFVSKLSRAYPSLEFGVVRDGYFTGEETLKLVNSLVDSGGVAILGLGAGKQEDVLIKLIEQGFQGSCYTCGGFIRQESASQYDYYPIIFDKLNLRFLYRMYKEPHTIKRYFFEYPKNIVLLAFLIVFRKLKIDIC